MLEAPRLVTRATAATPGQIERWVVAFVIVFGAILRMAYVFHHDVNIDEPQHLHVAWAWTQGLLPYRDVFDNHSPLLGILFAPVLSLLGPRADIIIGMRLAMMPFSLLTLVASWILFNRLFGIRAAAWAVAVAGVNPDFIERGLEYRSDVPWMALWICGLAAVLTPRASTRRFLVGGLLLGASLMASMKTSILIVGLVMAAIGTALVSPHARWKARERAGRIAAAVAGMVLIPTLIATFFALNHAWWPFVDGLVLYNLVPGMGRWASTPWLPLLAIPLVPALLWSASRIIRSAPDEPTGVSRSVLFLTATFYWLAIQTTWPIVTRQDWLPFVPMAAGLLVALAFAALSSARPPFHDVNWKRMAWIAPLFFAIGEVTAVSIQEPAWIDKTGTQRATLSGALRLTTPSDWVLDLRGESIFRRRAIREVLEPIAVERIQKGLQRDDIEERARATRAPIAYYDNDAWPAAGRAFLARNYISVGIWRVLGFRLTRPADGETCDFDIAIPERYAILCQTGAARGMLDGTPYTGARVLSAGHHRYRATNGELPAVVIWAPALERGFVPALQWVPSSAASTP